MSDQVQPRYQHDLEKTIAARERLQKNVNLMYWYQELYRELCFTETHSAQKKVLEIGSGTSPLKRFLPSVVTSDVLKLDHVDLVFDCHKIATLDQIADHSIDVISLTNVLHHLQDPLKFLQSATKKLKKGGEVVMVEPYYSLISHPLYRLFHHERSDFKISRPLLPTVDGPLSSSNQAIPYMIFFKKADWLGDLSDFYNLEKTQSIFYTSISYFITGGISRVFPIPGWLYRRFFTIDHYVARRFPNIFASFFTLRLVTKS